MSELSYFNELKRSMDWLAEQDQTIFLGQAVNCPGTGMRRTLENVANHKLLEFPVAEEFQMGFSIGMALQGYTPITIFPRWNFLLLATNQIVNHLDKIVDFSSGEYTPSLIIRTAVGSERPLHPQHQHVGNFSSAFRCMTRNIEIIELEEPEDIFSSYQKAYNRKDGKSTLLVEYGDFYNEK